MGVNWDKLLALLREELRYGIPGVVDQRNQCTKFYNSISQGRGDMGTNIKVGVSLLLKIEVPKRGTLIQPQHGRSRGVSR